MDFCVQVSPKMLREFNVVSPSGPMRGENGLALDEEFCQPYLQSSLQPLRRSLPEARPRKKRDAVTLIHCAFISFVRPQSSVFLKTDRVTAASLSPKVRARETKIRENFDCNCENRFVFVFQIVLIG